MCRQSHLVEQTVDLHGQARLFSMLGKQAMPVAMTAELQGTH